MTFTEEQTEQMEELAEELDKLKDQHLRQTAEYDNYRKRTARERENIYTNAMADIVAQFLPVYDNLERALRQTDEESPHRQGLEMIFGQFKETLEKLGVTEIEAVGQPFDPEKHCAVIHVDDKNYGDNIVVEEFEKGFAMGDKIIRFANVKVAN